MSDYSGEQWLEQKLRDRIRELEAALVLREIGKLARSVSPDTALLPDPTKPYECPVCRRPIDAGRDLRFVRQHEGWASPARYTRRNRLRSE